MCIRNPECQRCETCGRKKWHLWVSEEMHPRGCPFGFTRMDACPETVNTAKRLKWMIGAGVQVSETGRALVEQLAALGVDLDVDPVEWMPQP